MPAAVSKIASEYVDQWEDGVLIKACADWHVHRAEYLLTQVPERAFGAAEGEAPAIERSLLGGRHAD
jgi:hypothetical protein